MRIILQSEDFGNITWEAPKKIDEILGDAPPEVKQDMTKWFEDQIQKFFTAVVTRVENPPKPS